MVREDRPFSVARQLAVCLLLLATHSICLAQSPVPPEALGDAELTCIAFVDADSGWAVGDRGVIWHTIDGGRHWQRQDSATSARLESVFFADAETGWAVGGGYRSYTHQSFGVVLRTIDGGKNWQNVPDTNLPALRSVKFFGHRQGIAVGETNAIYPSGVFTTSDGGRSWASVPIDRQEGGTHGRSRDWIAADFAAMHGGLIAGSDGCIARLNGMTIAADKAPASQNMNPLAVTISRDGMAWLAGERGQLMSSGDGGETWHPSTTLDPAARHFDLHAVATCGEHIWVAGDPGSVVFHSPDAGRTWERHAVDSRIPLHHLCFLDENRGWAVGALGAILATRDGGHSWRVQRQGGARTPLLAIASQLQRVPHELIVQQAGNEGYLTGIEILTSDGRPELARRSKAAGAVLLASATSTAARFPLPRIMETATLEQVLSAWDAGDRQAPATKRLEEHLVRRIRTWQPDVIVTEDAHPSGDDPLAHLTNQMVLAAAAKAGEASAYPEQLSEAGLAAWQTKKVIAATTSDKQGDVKLVCAQLAPRIGASPADVADEARSLIEQEYSVAPGTRGFSILVDHLPQGQGRRDIFSGIALQAGGDARRALSKPPIPDFTALSKQIQRRQVLQGLLERSEKDPLRGQAWLAQMNELTRGLPPATSCRMMYHLGQRYQFSGQHDLAAEVMSGIATRYPDQPLSDSALLNLMRYHGSAEAAHAQRHLSATAASRVRPAVAEENNVPGAVKQVSATSEGNTRLERAVGFGKLLEKNRPMLFAEPGVRLSQTLLRTKSPSASLERERLLQGLAASTEGAWSDCAKAELWVTGRSGGPCPKPTFVCKPAASKPVLDGRLDDESWQAARPVTLKESDKGTDPLDTIVALMHDEEFLYIATSCRRSSELEYKTNGEVRQRDTDLSRHDRVETLLDTDRDYASYWRLAIDHRGWAAESCLGDTSWNPEWFIAASGDDAHWTAEAAIPLDELAAEKKLGKQCWSVGLQRILPAVALQSWTPGAELDIRPESFGLMQWE